MEVSYIKSYKYNVIGLTSRKRTIVIPRFNKLYIILCYAQLAVNIVILNIHRTL